LQPESPLDQQEMERIARAALKELGVSPSDLSIAPVEGQPGHWRIDVKGAGGPSRLKIRCGQGSTAQWVRDQIFDQYNS
jgi:hypothetical protein